MVRRLASLWRRDELGVLFSKRTDAVASSGMFFSSNRVDDKHRTSPILIDRHVVIDHCSLKRDWLSIAYRLKSARAIGNPPSLREVVLRSVQVANMNTTRSVAQTNPTSGFHKLRFAQQADRFAARPK